MRVRFHLAEELRIFTRAGEDGPGRVEFAGRRSVKDLVESVGVPHCEIGRVEIDGIAVPLDHVLDSDAAGRFRVHVRVSAPTATELHAQPARFALDGHLGRLTAYLRALGLDALHRGALGEADFVERAAAEDRILLSRDVGLLKLTPVRHGAFVRATDPREQLAEIVTRYGLADRASPFTRCMACNEVLVDAPRDTVAESVPERVLARFTDFKRCPGCGRVFWRGTHHERLARLVAEVLAAARRRE